MIKQAKKPLIFCFLFQSVSLFHTCYFILTNLFLFPVNKMFSSPNVEHALKCVYIFVGAGKITWLSVSHGRPFLVEK